MEDAEEEVGRTTWGVELGYDSLKRAVLLGGGVEEGLRLIDPELCIVAMAERGDGCA